MKLSSIKPNDRNPRYITDPKFKKLVQSIKEFPKMMELRPIVIFDDGLTGGGNMRYRALVWIKNQGIDYLAKTLKECNKLENLKYFDPIFEGNIPDSWVKKASDLTEEEKQRFIIADNVGFGDWNWDMLANEWDMGLLDDWGLEFPAIETEEPPKEDEKYFSIKILLGSKEEKENVKDVLRTAGYKVK